MERGKERKKVPILDFEENPNRITLEKTDAVRQGLKTQFTQYTPRVIRTRVLEVEGKEKEHYANPTSLTQPLTEGKKLMIPAFKESKIKV